MNMEWNKLRTFNGSVQDAFEELVCQLASIESIASLKKFNRIAPPDAGVECFCELDNGKIWGWQAKFFDKLGQPQWNQIDSSVKTAIDKYPTLVKYFICTPIDRASPRKNGQKWSMDVWEAKAKAWKQYAKRKRRTIEFEYWGNHEIFQRLAKDENRGRRAYWFNTEIFTMQWFSNLLDENIKNLGPRYSPQLNVSLPIAKVFDGLSRDEAFEKRCRQEFEGFITGTRSLSKSGYESVDQAIDLIRTDLGKLMHLCKDTPFRSIGKVEWDGFLSMFQVIGEKTSAALRDLETMVRDSKTKKSTKQDDKGDPDHHGDRRALERILHATTQMEEFIRSPTVQLSINPLLVVNGRAGVGKSHLLADVAVHRKSTGLPTLLFLGQHFTTGDPWQQMLQRVQTNLTREEFLGALDSYGKALNSRVLIFIDAINEGDGRLLWPDNLTGLLTTFKRYPFIGVALSIRSSYADLLLPRQLKQTSNLIEVEHHGFANQEYLAAKVFFSWYKIALPNIPLLNPEFSNPLFLRLFCEGLSGEGFKKIPDGFEGITKILEYFLRSINNKISTRYNVPLELALVQKVVKDFAAFSTRSQNRVTFSDGFSFIQKVPELRNINHGEFLSALISEGVITKNLSWDQTGAPVEYLYLMYERFADHLTCAYYLDKTKSKKAVGKLFLKGGGLFKFTRDDQELIFNKGIIDALAIQLPDRFGVELFDVVKGKRKNESVLTSVIESIPWRAKATFNERVYAFINKHIKGDRYRYESFVATILSVSLVPSHFFNADFLHRILSSQSMPDRDASWSQAISHKYHYENAHIVKRLVDWVYDLNDTVSLDNVSAEHAATVLTWFLSSSDNVLRNATTKALVNLLTSRIDVLIDIMKKFNEVNDPYITQRLYAVACGCTLRNGSAQEAHKVARFVSEAFFSKVPVPVDILTRDYARNIIEYAYTTGFTCTQNFRPPYNSKWIGKLPKIEQLKKKFDGQAFQFLVGSITVSDFADYVLHAGKGHSSWTGLRFGESKKNRKTIFNEFIKGLSRKQKLLWDNLNPLIGESRPLETGKGGGFEQIKINLFVVKGRKTDGQLRRASALFNASLSAGQKKLYLQQVKPFLDHNRDVVDDIQSLDMRMSQAFILNRVLEFGWSPTKHGSFDSFIGHPLGHDRQPRPIERIGKKYQWIAYYEFMARVADNFQFKEGKYQGPWEPYLRDIDPTTILRKKENEELQSFWWSVPPYTAWSPQSKTWTKKTTDLPSAESLLIRKDDNGTEWLILEANHSWQQPLEIDQERFVNTQKDLWYHTRSYITTKSEQSKLIKNLKGKNFMNDWLPSSNARYEVFSREYYWAPSCDHYRQEAYPEYGLSIVKNQEETEMLGTAFVTTAEYSWDKDPLRFHLPSQIIFTLMNLHHGKIDGQFENEHGDVVCFDPSATHPSASCLLVRRKDFLQMLSESDLSIFWTFLGAKEIIAAHKIFDELNVSSIVEFSGNKLKTYSTFFTGNKKMRR